MMESGGKRDSACLRVYNTIAAIRGAMTREQILYEDNDIIVCYKPAGIATQTAKIGQRDMVSEVTNYLAGIRASGQRNAGQSGPAAGVYVGCVHRLDQPVEGILVFARNQKAAGGLSRQIVENRMDKYYYAVVSGDGPEAKEEQASKAGLHSVTDNVRKGMLTDYLIKDNQTNMSRIVPSDARGAKKAVLEYEMLKRAELPAYCSLVRVRLITGRHHQIRVQMSHAGMSLLGDYKYADERTRKLSGALQVKQVALCAYRLDFAHPQSGKRMSFQKEPEGDIFQKFSR